MKGNKTTESRRALFKNFFATAPYPFINVLLYTNPMVALLHAQASVSCARMSSQSWWMALVQDLPLSVLADDDNPP